MIDKSLLLTALLEKLQIEFDLQLSAAVLAHDEATNEESRAENKYDTRGQEAAYLAEGQAKLANALSESISFYRFFTPPSTLPPNPVDIGSVFQVERSGKIISGFIGPRAGGTEFSVDGVDYTLVTPASPLGQAIMGRKQGDTFYLVSRGKPQPHRIVSTA